MRIREKEQIVKKRIQAVLQVGIVLSSLISGCVANDAVERQPPIDTDTDQYLNPSDASGNTEDDIERANREWLEESQKPHLNRHR